MSFADAFFTASLRQVTTLPLAVLVVEGRGRSVTVISQYGSSSVDGHMSNDWFTIWHISIQKQPTV